MIVALVALVLAHGSDGNAHHPKATYLGNAGVLITNGDTKIVFDPLYRELFDRYEPVPPELEAKLFAGAPPFDGLDAVFISHHHRDHFSPKLIQRLLRSRQDLHLVAPRQAVRALVNSERFLGRVHPIDLNYGDAPVRFSIGTVNVDAVRVPHRGWPKYRSVENIVFRVTLNGAATVTHLGDADSRPQHFPAGQWESLTIDLALPPHWFFESSWGRGILKDRIKARHSVGVHVPARVPDAPAQRAPAYRDVDLFTSPGETRRIDTAPR
ncbi:MAG: MBL fold metallo-hydrolase [Myxococcota bacterium]